MKIFKKQFSVLMTLLMVLTLVPISAFADTNTSIIGGVQTFTTEDTNKEVKLKMDLGKFVDLKEGRVSFELFNGMLSKTNNAATATVYQGKTVITAPDVVFLNTSEKSLQGGEKMFNLEINKSLQGNSDNIEVVVSLKLDFSQSSNEDVKILLKDFGKNGIKTNIGDFDSVLAVEKSKTAKNPEIKIKGDKNVKVGPSGGALASLNIYNMDKFSKKASDNKVKVILPLDFVFDKNTKVTFGKGTPLVSYSENLREMTVEGITSDTEQITIEPYVLLAPDAKSQEGAIIVSFNFLSDNRTISSEDTQLGVLAKRGITLTAIEKGGQRIPELTKGETKTIQLTLDAVEGTLVNGDLIEFALDQSQIVYGTLKVNEPAGILLTASKSAGKTDSDKVSGKEVYMENYFKIRTNKADITKIIITFDIVANPFAQENATIKAKASKYDEQKIEIAKIKPAINVSIAPMAFEKGKIADLPAVSISESEKGQLLPNDKIYLELTHAGSDREKGEHIAFQTAKDIKIESTNKLEVQSVELGTQPNILIVTIKRKSDNQAATIKLSNIKGYLSEKAIVGEVALTATLNNAKLQKTSFFTVSGEPTQGTTKFVIGQKNYVANGMNKTLITAPYINNGRTMLPVRAVGESLGLGASWNNSTKTATFENASKVAIVKIGQNKMTVNGTQYPLSAPAEIKNGSTMIELRSLATAFGVDIKWDSATKTVIVN